MAGIFFKGRMEGFRGIRRSWSDMETLREEEFWRRAVEAWDPHFCTSSEMEGS